MSDDVVFGDCLDCGAQWAYGARVHADDCAYMRPTRVRQRPVSRTAPTEPPPPYSAMPAKPAAHAHDLAYSPSSGCITCAGCDLSIGAFELRLMGLRGVYDRERTLLADAFGMSQAKLRDLESENSRLRRDVERLTRKAGER